MTQGTSGTWRLRTIIGFCLAIIRIALSDIRELASKTPSTAPSSRSVQSRSS